MKISRSGRVALIKTCTKWQVGRLRAALLLPTSGGAPKGRAGPTAAMPRLGATLRHSLTNDKEFLWTSD